MMPYFRGITALVIIFAVSATAAIIDLGEDSFSSSVDSFSDSEDACDCDSARCPPTPDACPHGRVIAPEDTCGCCYVCGNKEWSYCDPEPTMYPEYFTFYLPWEKLPPRPMWDPQSYKFGRCGWGLQCTFRGDMGPSNSLPVFVCTCQDRDVVCGSDGKSYENACNLREEAVNENSTVVVKTRAMCLGVPIIATPPSNHVGEDSIIEDMPLVLSCEVNANPPANISWTKNDNLLKYMGPNRRKSIHSRPGISIYTRTSWIKVYAARKSDIGTYKCIATNSYGSTTAEATVNVVLRSVV